MVRQAAQRVDGWLSEIPFHPWAFAAFPVLRLYGENLTDVEPGDLLLPLLVLLAGATLGMATVGLLLRDARRAAIVVSAIIVPVSSFGLAVDLLPGPPSTLRPILLVATALLIVLAIIAALRARSALASSLTAALNVLSLTLLVIAAIPVGMGMVDVLRTAEGPALTATATGAAAGAPSRDIYHLVLDRYGSDRALEAGFDIDNSGFTDWLREQGFQVLDDAHANYARTTLSLASTLGMSLLDDIAAEAGPASQNLGPVVSRIRRSRAGAALQDLGYEYVHLGPAFLQTRDSAIADRVLHPQQATTFGSSLLELTIIPALLGRPEPSTTHRQDHAAAAEFQLGALDDIRDDPAVTYTLAHLLLPHPPYVFLEDGTVDPDEATFESQLRYTNQRLRAFIGDLLAVPEDEQPIVILQADEGPFPRRLQRDQEGFDWSAATDAELITKFGILDAWYLPGPEGEAPLPPGMTAVNTYPELLRRYFGVDISDEPDRILASTVDRPYDMLDVTGRVAAAELGASPETASRTGS